jgi:lipoprotein-anchoring transpeptidase ErfK/SrfK
MKMRQLNTKGFAHVAILLAVVAGVAVFGTYKLVVSNAATTAAAQVREAQTIAKKFGLPVGVADGVNGPQTARGMCAFRSIAGLTASRAAVDAPTLSKLRSYNTRYASLTGIAAPALSGRTTYLIVNKTCQSMVFVKNGFYRAVMPVSTGMPGHDTPVGSYTLGGTQKGWQCSTLYPESCNKQSTGRFVSVSSKGNMYNPRELRGAIFLHGSTSVPTYPASHGCVRVTVATSDWMFDNVDAALPLRIVGTY